jgi:predicted NAD/FAD-dependent oxidoreductase
VINGVYKIALDRLLGSSSDANWLFVGELNTICLIRRAAENLHVINGHLVTGADFAAQLWQLAVDANTTGFNQLIGFAARAIT